MGASRNSRARLRNVPTTALSVEDILDAPAIYSSSEIRHVGPAIVLIAERDAPLRVEVLATSRGDGLALQEFIRSDRRVRELLDTYFAYAEDDPLIFEREDRHVERLDAGRPLSTRCDLENVRHQATAWNRTRRAPRRMK